MFESLVPLKPFTLNPGYGSTGLMERSPDSSALFYQDTTIDPGNARERNFSATSPLVRPVDIEPLVPALPNDPQPQDPTSFYLQSVLDFMVSRVTKINWKDQKETMHFLCFGFLFDQFKEVYVRQFFPDLNLNNSIYDNNNFILPHARSIEEAAAAAVAAVTLKSSLIDQEVAAKARAVIIHWMARYVSREVDTSASRTLIPSGQPQPLQQTQRQYSLPGMPFSVDPFVGNAATEFREPSPFEYDIVRSTFCSSRQNVNLLNEIFRQSFLLPFAHSTTMRRVISVYKEWVSKTSRDVPLFLEEPEKPDSALEVRVGLQKVIRAFVSNSANVFVLSIPPDHPHILEEQVDMCKRVLNIYRFMVMKLDMDKETWEQLLLILLRITSIVIPRQLPIRKEEVLGGRLAPAFFQTLIVTWIRANLHVHISITFWEEFQKTLSQLTEWEELIREWSKTMDTITRVMCRFVYNINLQDLPLDRLSVDRKDRRRRGITRMESADDAAPAASTGRQNTIEERSPLHQQHHRHHQQSHQQLSLQQQQATSSTTPPATPNRAPPLSNHETHQGQHEPQPAFIRNDWPVAPPRRRSSTGVGSSAVRQKIKSAFHVRNRSNSDSELYFSTIREKALKSKCPAGKAEYERQNSRSLDLLDHVADDISDTSFMTSRSPSPTHSSGRDSTSLREGEPLNLDGVSLNSNMSETSAKCVVAGGHYKGWASDSAVILWRRMLGVLGDITSFTNPTTFALVVDCLYKIVEDLIKVKDNLCVSETTSLPPPTLVPPIGYFSPWLIKCLQLSDDFKRGKLSALKILCQITLRRHETQPNPAFLCQFYNTMQVALASKDVEVVATILKNSGGKFFSYGLPGATCLLHPLLDGTSLLLSSETKKEMDLRAARSEGLSLLGVVVGMSAYLEQIQRINHSPDASPDRTGKDFKERLLNLILRGVRKDLSIPERCLALNCLGLFVYQELAGRSKHAKLHQAINELISSTLYKDRLSLRVACQNLMLQCDHVVYLLDDHPDIPRKIIEGLNRSLLVFVNQNRNDTSIKEIVLTVIMCLGEWCMSVPQDFLKTKHFESNTSLLFQIMKTLNSIIGEEECLMETSGFELLQSESDSTLRAPDARAHNQVHFGNEEPFRDDVAAIKLAAKMLLGYLVNHLGHFPRPQLRAARLSCVISESDDNPFVVKSSEEKDDLTLEVLQAQNTLFFVLNDSSIISFTEIKCNPCDQQTFHFPQDSRVRIIVRDLIGKFVWDCSQVIAYEKEEGGTKPISQQRLMHEQTSDEYDEEDTIRTNERVDMLDSLLLFTGQNGPDSFQSRKRGQGNSSGASTLTPLGCQAEENMIALLLNQHYQEINFMEQKYDGRDVVSLRNNKNALTHESIPSSSSSSSPAYQRSQRDENSFFSSCRRLIDQLGFLCWEKRSTVELLAKNDKVLRELRNLDKQCCRETHKIAVIYVAEGQEDKNSILLNTSGSRAFEAFVSGLGWEVDLETHTGFRGGLQANKSTGVSAPYYATSLLEVIFHVSTRIPASLDESDSLTRKLRHLGNDEIHIIWSDHWRDYRRGIIPTEFGDVLIIIYPVRDSCDYYRISIIRKPEVQFFGPLTHGSVVHGSLLSGLVRATAINGSRAQRLNVPFYQNFFEERARSIESIVLNKETMSFEDFAAATYNPASALSPAGLGSRPASVLSASLTSTSTLRDVSSGPSSAFPDSHSDASVSIPAAVAVREEASPSPKIRSRPISSVLHYDVNSSSSSSSVRVNLRDRPLSAAPASSSPSAPFH